MNYYRWEENIQLKISFLHHSWHSPVFTQDHLEMWHQFRVIRKGQCKAKTFSGTHYNTSLRDSCQCHSISNTVHRFQRNSFVKWRQWASVWVLWHRNWPVIGSLFSPYICSTYNLISHTLESMYVCQESSVTLYILYIVSSLRVCF